MKKLIWFFLITLLLLIIIPVGELVLLDVVYAFLSLFSLGSGLLIALIVIDLPVLIVCSLQIA